MAILDGILGSPLDCEGGCFLHELPDAAVARWQRLINATRRLGGGQQVFVYQNSGIDSSRNASVEHADSAITVRFSTEL